MEIKRLTLFAGHYGSGKTNIALNYAVYLRRQGLAVAIADLDIVNPYFRTKDSAAALEALGIPLIASPFAGSNLGRTGHAEGDLHASCGADRYGVLDIGGDDRGALALGRYASMIKEEGDYEMRWW